MKKGLQVAVGGRGGVGKRILGEHMVFRGNGGRGGGQSSSKEFKEGL